MHKIPNIIKKSFFENIKIEREGDFAANTFLVNLSLEHTLSK